MRTCGFCNFTIEGTATAARTFGLIHVSCYFKAFWPPTFGRLAMNRNGYRRLRVLKRFNRHQASMNRRQGGAR